jgi:hypothetical protein
VIAYSSFSVSGEQEKDAFNTHALAELNEAGYKLEACIQMARGAPLGLGSRRELWIFKSVERQRRDSVKSVKRESVQRDSPVKKERDPVKRESTQKRTADVSKRDSTRGRTA